MSQNQPHKLFLLDAMALIYRAHFAFSKNPRINSKGLNTGVMLGFTNTLMEVLTKEKPSHIAVAFDTSAPTFRHEQFEPYKANRQEQPEDITVSIPWVKEIVKAFRIPVLEMDGFEADDIIGTLAKKAERESFTVYMMTPDKDYGQIVDDHIYLYKPAFMGNGVDVMGPKEVCAKWDIEHVDQVRDILGLMGDAVDNIPGIPGIGAKTATKLLKEFGTVEELIKNTDKLKGKQKENVENFAQQGILSKELATIKIDVPIAFNEEDLRYDGFDEEKLRAIFNELEFRTLSNRIFKDEGKKAVIQKNEQLGLFGEAPSSSPASEIEFEEESVNTSAPVVPDTIHSNLHHYHKIKGKDAIEELMEYLMVQKVVCFDTETTALNAMEAELVGISFAYLSGEAYYIPCPADQKETQAILELLMPFFENEDILKVGQNIKYDLLVLKNYGIEVKGALYDTMLAHYLIEPEGKHSMDWLAEQYLNYKPVSITELIGKKGKNQGNMRDVDEDEVTSYAAEDADITLRLKEKFDPLLKENELEKLFYEVENPLINVLTDMEFEGVKIDTDSLAELSQALEEESIAIEKRVYELAGVRFNLASPKQLGDVLFEKLKLDPKAKKTKTGQYATGEEILSKLADEHEIAQAILDYRQMVKLKSTYVDALPTMINSKTGRIHTTYNQFVAATGRLSSINPNLQNIPIRTERGREIRKAFVARDENHVLLAADYSQIELRIMAAFSGDESMIEAFKNGRDIHATTAAKIFQVPLEEVSSDMRRKAKTANFGIIYGISAFGLSQRLSIPRGEAKEIIDAYFKEFPAVKEYMDGAIEKARKDEYVETILGRRRYLRDINSRNQTMRGFAERNAINAPIQGSAADLIKVAMIDVHNWMKKEKLKSKMILQVHDELVFDAHKDEVEILKKNIPGLMSNAIKLAVPVEVEVGLGKDWLEAH
ncbi:MAG TPA: DNA polymerase I [Algoriphagus sp.]|jgi:DNA polymerase-1|uniref:DNA polymerase I n=1 Tax=unclassified Algoriphagus TaxID=2641541 RepID=UPI000C682620|nr:MULTISPECIES: DNA polymerase I [unclassified Algoriphagus]MAL14839.1 DNA polymerase I [Algoriphagus sp.]MAN87899.1 DNA polymerase I [Algoriphagus sp.]QYH40414.1 DNA polymerase I [Algoriphagus sp. NBT04N3]HCB47751.1 DNA polymerase I [Algoriphagus sp.]HCD88154.1 DNA polymerase I [Algoriphagus sp.]